LSSNLNWSTGGAPPTPNQVSVGLSSGGAIDVFNLQGNVDVFNYQLTKAKFTDVTAQAVGGSVATGIDFVSATAASLTNVDASGSSATTSRGVWIHNGGAVVIRDSTLTGANHSVFFQAGVAPNVVHITDTVLSGPTAGGVTCVNTLTTSLAPAVCA
jgi:hypothetical protein